MPSSRPNAIPVVIHVLKQLQPQSILDVGVGFGKWGHLFREYTDIIHSEHNPERYLRDHWKVRIDGVEGYPEYLTDMHRFLYDRIIESDLRECVSTLDTYDMVFLGDIIEHFVKQEGIDLIHALLAKTNKAIVLSTPKYETGQQDSCDNELETHRSLWTQQDFLAFPQSRVVTVTKTLLIAVIAKPGVPIPQLTPEIAGLPNTFLRRVKRKFGRVMQSHSVSG